MDWKIILLVAVLILPLTYCELERQSQYHEIRIECIKQKGQWTNGWGGVCSFN